jgi:hypothetical protein
VDLLVAPDHVDIVLREIDHRRHFAQRGIESLSAAYRFNRKRVEIGDWYPTRRLLHFTPQFRFADILVTREPSLWVT